MTKGKLDKYTRTELEKLLFEVAQNNELPYDQLLSRCKKTELALVRKYWYHLTYNVYKFKSTDIAAVIGRDHTAVLFGARTYLDLKQIKDSSIDFIKELKISNIDMKKIKLKLKFDELTAIYEDLFNNVGTSTRDYFSILQKAALVELYTKLAPKTMFRVDGAIKLSITIAQAAALVMHINLSERDASKYIDNVYLRLVGEIDRQIKG